MTAEVETGVTTHAIIILWVHIIISIYSFCIGMFIIRCLRYEGGRETERLG